MAGAFTDLRNPLTGELAGSYAVARPADVERALQSATAALAFDFPSHARYSVLQKTAALIEAATGDYARAIALEGSKSIREAHREPPRAANILRLCAEQARGIAGETLPFDSRIGSEKRVGYFTRVPAGIIAAIGAFNDPLAVAAHKIGPALAGGNAILYKPSPLTPFSAVRLAEHFAQAGLPDGRLHVLIGDGEIGEAMVRDARVRIVSFTGGYATGEQITRVAGVKKLLMELGSNSPVIVMPDADLDRAARAICDGAFAQAGQNCLSVQRVLIVGDIYERLATLIAQRTQRLMAGSSLDEATDVCAMISESQAARVEQWISEAVEAGARVLTGGRREGALVWPTVMEDVPAGVQLDCEEVYGPVVSLYRARSLDDAIEQANNVRYGLHAAIFTENLRSAFEASSRLSAGAVMVNDSTDYRLDVMPFGGLKSSGIGREGIRFAVEAMTEAKVVCFNL